MFRNYLNRINNTAARCEDDKATRRFADATPASQGRRSPTRRPSLGALIMLALAINGLITLVGIIRPAHAYNQDLEKLNRFVQTSSASRDELAIFREGRDLIEDQEWEDAAKK